MTGTLDVMLGMCLFFFICAVALPHNLYGKGRPPPELCDEVLQGKWFQARHTLLGQLAGPKYADAAVHEFIDRTEYRCK